MIKDESDSCKMLQASEHDITIDHISALSYIVFKPLHLNICFLYLFISSPLLKVRPLLIPLSSSSICKGTVATSGVMDTTPTRSSKSIATSVIAATSATRFGDRPSDRASATVRWANRAFGSPPKKGFKPENHVRLGQDMISQNYSESLLMGIQTIRNH